MTVSDAVTFVLSASQADLLAITKACELRKNQIASACKREIAVGDPVEFTSGKKRSPYTYTAIVESKNHSRATVKITGPSWAKYQIGSKVIVPYAMLKAL